MRELDVEVVKFKTLRPGNQVKENKARPIQVELEEEQNKYNFFKKATNIRNTQTTGFKKVINSTDMTLLEQKELDKILREELKVRRNAGEKNIKRW